MESEQGWECVISWQVGADGMKQSLFQGQLKFNLISLEDETVVFSKVVVMAGSHCRSPGLITQKSQIQTAKQTPIWQYMTVSQEGKLINFDIVNPLLKINGGRGRMYNFVFWKTGSVLFASEWVAIAWRKACVMPAEI